MSNWQAFLTDAERQRIEAIPAERKALTAEYKRIYDRCRKRMDAARQYENAKEQEGWLNTT